MLTPPNYLRRDPSNVTDDTEARHTAHTAAAIALGMIGSPSAVDRVDAAVRRPLLRRATQAKALLSLRRTLTLVGVFGGRIFSSPDRRSVGRFGRNLDREWRIERMATDGSVCHARSLARSLIAHFWRGQRRGERPPPAIKQPAAGRQQAGAGPPLPAAQGCCCCPRRRCTCGASACGGRRARLRSWSCRAAAAPRWQSSRSSRMRPAVSRPSAS